MKTSDNINEIAAALAKAQKTISVVVKDKAVNAGKYKYSYADLASVWSACRDALADQELAVAQSPEVDGPNVTIHTRLMHNSGQWIEGHMQLNAGSNGIQQVGSAITYGRRYALMSFLMIAPEDDDGGRAQAAAEQAAANAHKSRQSPSPQTDQQQSQQSEPKAKKPPHEAIKDALRKAGCANQADANLVLNWATGSVFGDQIPLQVISDPEIAATTLERLRNLHREGVDMATWLEKARGANAAMDDLAANEF